MQTLTIHSVKRVILEPIKHVTTNEPFFYRYIEIQDASGNAMQMCLYSTNRAALEIEPEGETK